LLLLFLKNLIVFNHDFPFFISRDVTYPGICGENWSWYGNHILYNNNVPNSIHFEKIYNTFIPKFEELVGFKSLIRIKVNFYPYTPSIHEHPPHADCNFNHHAAVYSLNTCDGYTRIGEEKIDSIENRIIFFDGSISHNSSTTTGIGRFNINFNWI
jgi:hypothetical protein